MFSSITTLSSVLLLSLLSGAVVSRSIIKTLPGFAGDLPFKLETGYIGVGELDEVQLFYYFIESERSPKDDPLMLWLTGGPGCSGLSGLLYEIDDMFITGDDDAGIHDLQQFLSKQFEIKDLGSLGYFLGLEVFSNSDGYCLSQAKYASDLLSRAGFSDCKIVDSPLETNAKLRAIDGELLLDVTLYRQLVGSLIYFTVTRLNLPYAVHLVSQFMTAPHFVHYAVVLRILRYVKGTLFHGPLSFNYANSSGNKPTLLLNPYSWTKVANIIFLDAPAGTGFSYAESWDGYNSNDTSTAAQNYEFLRKWLMAHSMFLSNPLYISGDSYSGITVPIVVQDILNGNEVGHLPPMNLKSTKKNCKGEYTYPDPSNAACIENLQVVSECIAAIRLVHILEPRCSELSQKPNKLWDWSYLSDSESIIDILASTPQVLRPWCRSYNYPFSNIWANDNTVQNALHVQEGTITTWDRCNESLAYKYNFKTSLDYQQNLTKKHLRGLVYSGDHDMVIPYVGTLEWIETLNLTIEDSWRPWFVDGQVAGYVTIYAEKQYSLTFTTIKGGGHTAPEYKPKETLAMIERWFAYYYL